MARDHKCVGLDRNLNYQKVTKNRKPYKTITFGVLEVHDVTVGLEEINFLNSSNGLDTKFLERSLELFIICGPSFVLNLIGVDRGRK